MPEIESAAELLLVNTAVWGALGVPTPGTVKVRPAGFNCGKGMRGTMACPQRAASTVLQALTLTVCTLVIVAGAVYRPLALIAPTCGVIDQVTEVNGLPVTVAVNGCVVPAVKAAVGGVTVTVICTGLTE